MPGSVASTEGGYGRVTPTTTRASSPSFSVVGSSSDRDIDTRLAQLNLGSSSSRSSVLSSEEAVSQKRREWYPIAWKRFLEKNNYDGVMTVVNRYLDITDKSEIDLDCYFAFVAASAANRNNDASVLDKIDMSNPSDSDLVDIHLLRCIVFLKYNDVEKALEEGKAASEKAFPLGLQDNCHYIMALVACYTQDYIEAAFRNSLLPAKFQLKPRFADLIKRLTFKEAKWHAGGMSRDASNKPVYVSPVDITKYLPMPAHFVI